MCPGTKFTGPDDQEELTGDFLEHHVAHEALEPLGIKAGPVNRHRVLQANSHQAEKSHMSQETPTTDQRVIVQSVVLNEF